MLEIDSSPNCFLIEKHYSHMIARLRGTDLAVLGPKKTALASGPSQGITHARLGQATKSKDFDRVGCGAFDFSKDHAYRSNACIIKFQFCFLACV